MIQFVRENVRTGLTAFANLTQQRVERAMDVAAVVVESNVKSRLKWRYRRGKGLGGRASGRLANSYAHTIKTVGTTTETTIGPGVDYAKYVEGYPQAPRRHICAAPGLLEWYWRHTGKRATALWVGGEAGTTPHLGPAMQTAGPKAMARLIDSLRFS